MAKKKPALLMPAVGTTVVGKHPTLKNKHTLTMLEKGMVRIERDPYHDVNPVTGELTTKEFNPLVEAYVNHQNLWHTIEQNPLC